MELKNYLLLLQRWGWILLVCLILAIVGGYWYSSRQRPIYEAEARFLVGPALANPNVTTGDLQVSSQVGETYATLITTAPAIESAGKKLKLDIGAGGILNSVTPTWDGDTQILTVRVRAYNAQNAANIANALGDVLIERTPTGTPSTQAERRQEASAEIAKLKQIVDDTQFAINELIAQMEQNDDATTDRALTVQLERKRDQLETAQRALIEQFRSADSGSTNQIAVLEPAVRRPIPVEPNLPQNLLAALIGAMVLGLSLMLICEYFTYVIYTAEELEDATRLPHLGRIVRHKRLRGAGLAQLVAHARPDTLAAESYRVLRANLQSTGDDRMLSSLLVTSPARGDGKSSIAANLAITLAQAGSSVLLIDANLRQPRLGALFGVPDDQGLTDLLHAPDLPPVPLPVVGLRGLSVLPAGTPTTNSPDLLASPAMARLLNQCRALADVVILDSSPLSYSDTLTLGRLVDGVLLVVNHGRTSREATVNAVESLRIIGAPLVGAVLNRVKAEAGAYYPLPATKRAAMSLATIEDVRRADSIEST